MSDRDLRDIEAGEAAAEAAAEAAVEAEAEEATGLVLEFALDAPAERVWRAIETPHLPAHRRRAPHFGLRPGGPLPDA